jgi:hypothetical protein
MFETIRLKIKTFVLARKRKEKVFVNPYASKGQAVNPKLNPYITEYGTKKTRSMQEMILDRMKKVEDKPIEKTDVVLPQLPVIKEPSFFADMKDVFIGDLMWIARRKQKPQVVEEPFSLYESDTT